MTEQQCYNEIWEEQKKLQEQLHTLLFGSSSTPQQAIATATLDLL